MRDYGWSSVVTLFLCVLQLDELKNTKMNSAKASALRGRVTHSSLRVRPACALLGQGVVIVQLSPRHPPSSRQLEAVQHDEKLLTETIKKSNTVGRDYELLTFAAIKTRNAAAKELKANDTIRRSAVV